MVFADTRPSRLIESGNPACNRCASAKRPANRSANSGKDLLPAPIRTSCRHPAGQQRFPVAAISRQPKLKLAARKPLPDKPLEYHKACSLHHTSMSCLPKGKEHPIERRKTAPFQYPSTHRMTWKKTRHAPACHYRLPSLSASRSVYPHLAIWPGTRRNRNGKDRQKQPFRRAAPALDHSARRYFST